MEKDLANYRKSYEKGELLLDQTPENPLELFKTWFDDVDTHFKDVEANAMTIATVGEDGFPKSRVVLLKQFTNEGFVFYTNYDSEKGNALAKKPKACLSFFWAAAERQVILKGDVQKIAEAESDAYFLSRPIGSQLGAIASMQSKPVINREALENQLKEVEDSYKNKPVTRPEHWGGYIVKPVSIEFWQGRANRLHDRVLYRIDNNYNWLKMRLQP